MSRKSYYDTLSCNPQAITYAWIISKPLQRRRNEIDSVSNDQPHDCLLNRLFRRRSRKHQSSASLAFVRGIPRWPVNSPYKGTVTRKMFPFDDVTMQADRSSFRGNIMLWFHNWRIVFSHLIYVLVLQWLWYLLQMQRLVKFGYA